MSSDYNSCDCELLHILHVAHVNALLRYILAASLYLSSNLFRNTMPTELSSLTKLRVLDLSRNVLTGRIPTQLEMMVELCEYLQVGMGAMSSVSNIANPFYIFSLSVLI